MKSYENEYRLPVMPDSFPDPVLSPSPGISRFFSPDVLELYESLYCRGLGVESLDLMGEFMSLFAPVSAIFAEDNRWYIRCKRKNAGFDHSDIFLPKRLSINETKDLFEEFELSTHGSHSFFWFLQFFAGLREQLPPYSGGFAYDEFTLFCDHPASEEMDFSDEYSEWEDALCFYFAANGDKLLVTDDGLTGWFFMAEHRVELFTNTFDEFAECYARFNIEFGGPFDAYTAFKIFG